jgi:hypothetical protein
MRGSNQEFKPVATVGLAKDGGIFVSPAAVRGYAWVYGPLRSAGDPEVVEHVTVQQRPKLHYHRSGIVRATLSGTRLELKEARYPPLPAMKRAQVMSILTVRPWELATHPGEPRRGDVFSIQPRWPQVVAFTLSVVTVPPGSRHTADFGELAPIGLLAGDPTRFVIDMSAHDVRALVIVLVTIGHDPEPYTEPGTTVAALPWHVGAGSQRPDEAFGLWSSSMRNPMIRLDADDEVLSPEDLVREREGVIRHMSIADKVKDMQERYWGTQQSHRDRGGPP